MVRTIDFDMIDTQNNENSDHSSHGDRINSQIDTGYIDTPSQSNQKERVPEISKKNNTQSVNGLSQFKQSACAKTIDDNTTHSCRQSFEMQTMQSVNNKLTWVEQQLS